MPGHGSDTNGTTDARERLVPKGDGDQTSSSSPMHYMPTYELSLPGSLPVTPPLEHAQAVTGIHAAQLDGGPGEAAGTNGVAPPGGHCAPAGVSSAVGVAPMDIQQALLPPAPPPEFVHPVSLARRRWTVFMFCLVAALLFADQNLLAPNLTAAANYFGMSERQKDVLLGGVLNAAFFMVGAPAALLVGWLADRGDVNRRTLLFWVVVVGTTPCLLTYWVRHYWQFFLLRALTGVAVGGCFPLVFSLLGDLFPPSRRAAVSAVVQIATGAGLAAGQALAGALGPATNWRLPFVVVAAPCLGASALMLGTTADPPRGAFEEALRERFAEGQGPYEGRISWRQVRALLVCPSNALIIAQGLPGSLPWGMVQSYINDYLSQQKGFTVQAATLVLLFFGGGAAIGVIGGGAGGQWLYNRRKEYQALFAGACVLVGIGPLYALINADLQSMGLGASCFLAGLAGCVASVAGPNVRAVLLNVNEPERRGTALALQSTTDDLGKGLGPVMVAGLIRVMGRKGAFNISTFGWVPCGALIVCLAFCMRRDEAAMQARLAAASDAAVAAAEAAEAEAGGRGGGIQLPTPPMRSEGGAGGAALAAADATAATAAARREERQLARVPLLGPGPASHEAAAAEVEAGRMGHRTSATLAAGTAGPHEDGPLPLSMAAVEVEPEGRPWGPSTAGRDLGPAAGGSAAYGAYALHAPPFALQQQQQQQQQQDHSQPHYPPAASPPPGLSEKIGGGAGEASTAPPQLYPAPAPPKSLPVVPPAAPVAAAPAHTHAAHAQPNPQGPTYPLGTVLAGAVADPYAPAQGAVPQSGAAAVDGGAPGPPAAALTPLPPAPQEHSLMPALDPSKAALEQR